MGAFDGGHWILSASRSGERRHRTAARDDTETVLAALKGLGSGNYAALAKATGLSKIAVISAITELRKGSLLNSEPGGKYSAAGHTPKQTKSAPATPSLATDLEKLAALRESGALTAAEYTKAKKKLLDEN
ncbi:MAG: SHOCT domain-containing protein [Acidobacteria bacterium]|nr:SHOCT domain-containing protein [Acidobacteriota bacterium]